MSAYDAIENISSVLELSTAHISEKTALWLDQQDQYPLVVYEKDEYGWVIRVPEMEDEERDEVKEFVPSDLVEVLQYANQCDCQWVMLDADAPVSTSLPAFEW